MNSNCPFDFMEQQIAKFRLMGGIIAFVLLAAQVIPVEGLHKEAALLEKYDTFQDLVSDIRNGNVDFNDFRNSDGISVTVMKDSDIYDELDTSTQDCIDLAGKIGNNLGDSEIVHCSEDPNYFKNKYSSNSSGAAKTTSTAANMETESVTAVSTPHRTATSTLTSNNFKNSILIDQLVKSGKFTENEAVEFVLIRELVKTGKFTENEAVEFAKKFAQTENQIISATDNINATSNAAGSADSLSTSSGNNGSQNSNSDPEDYDDLGQLVDDIKNAKVNANKISLADFQNSGAYARTDGQTQDCIDLAGKIGNNLGDSEIVHCSEDPNYFKNKYS